MTEIIQQNVRRTLRYRLLLSVSSAAVLVFVPEVRAEDSHPTVWIELGGAFDQFAHDSDTWVSPNLPDPISNPSPEPFGKTPAMGYDFEAAIEIQPKGSDWIYSASVRYGRAQRGPKRVHDQTYQTHTAGFNGTIYLTTYAFLNATEQSRSAHAIVDFNVGRDVGLGSFHGGRSTAHFGIRLAQLNERAEASFSAATMAPARLGSEIVHKADALMARSYSGIGPAVSWDGATPIAGSLEHGFSLDWGANASVLFGRQKARIALHTQDAHYNLGGAHTALSHLTSDPSRDRTVVVPNLGAFAGLSWRLPVGKISLGYRADFFFGAIDGGVETRKTYDRSFYGPFATISIGLGG